MALGEHEGAGTVGVQVGVVALVVALDVGGFRGLVLFRPRLAHDVQEHPFARQDGIGRRGGDFDGVVVHLLDVGRLGAVALHVRARGQATLPGEDDVVRRER
ncbi:hypothetical protein D9M69_630490 [compost metagenome]